MIRNELYTKYLSDISCLAKKLNYTLDNLPSCSNGESMEETEIRHALSRAAEKLNEAKGAIEYYSKPTQEGSLREDDTGKYEIDFINGGRSYPLTCGSDLEVYLMDDAEADIDEGWHSGRVEHTTKNGQTGYYFYGANKPFLYNGMRVRQREKE